MHPLQGAVKLGLTIQQQTGKLFVWLCVTNNGCRRVNVAAVSQFEPPVTEEDLEHGYPIDRNAGKGKIAVCPGVSIRLTRNIDKDRGLVNGPLAVVCQALVDYNPTKEQT